MHWTRLDFCFWAVGLFGNAALLFVLLYRRRAIRFPVFSALIALNLVRSAILFGVSLLGSQRSYSWSYWTLGLLDTALQFAIVYEIATLVFRLAGVWAPDVRQRFLWLLAPSVAIALGLSWLATPPTHLLVEAIVARGNLCSESLMSELFVIMMALSIGARIPWKTQVAKLAQGLGTYSLITLIIQAGHSYFGVSRGAPMYEQLSHLRMAAYLGCVLYWIVALWTEEESTLPIPEELRESLFAIQTRVAYDLRVMRSRK